MRVAQVDDDFEAKSARVQSDASLNQRRTNSDLTFREAEDPYYLVGEWTSVQGRRFPFIHQHDDHHMLLRHRAR